MTRNATKGQKKPRKGRDARATERRIAHAVIHPVRLDALSILFERVASPKEISEQLTQPLGTVSFHVVELLKDDAIELVKTEQRRGAVEHYYRARLKPEISNEEMRAMPKAARRKVVGLILQAIIAEGLASLRHGKMDDDDDLNLVWMPMSLDVQGRDEVSELQAEMVERLEGIKARNATRATDDDESTAPPVRIATMMWFERGRTREGRSVSAG